MRALAVLTEELESRPGDADRVDALARHLRAVGRSAGALAGEWLVAGARTARPVRLTLPALAEAARVLAAERGLAPWLFDVGQAAGDEAAEAIALLLPWPDGEPDAASRPALADWMADWAAASAQPAAIAARVAGLDDAIARRWAVRAVCGLAKPLVDEWQWQRAWARAFDADEHAVAWWWHHRRDALLHDMPGTELPRPHAFAPLSDAPDDLRADLLAAWRQGEWHAEPRWNGVRVHVVRRGDDVAVWQRGGRLLNARLPAAWLAEPWPDVGAIEAVLLAWHAGRVAALDDAWAPRKRPAADRPTLHLALVDWHGGPGEHGARRSHLLARWPQLDRAGRGALPAIFTTPTLPAPEADIDLASHARAARADGCSGLVLRHRASTEAWTVRTPPRRIRAVLQYVPTEAFAADPASARALAVEACGFALWNRVPLSEEERHAAMTAAMSGQFLPPPEADPALDGLRLLPLARVAVDLPDDELPRLHAWLRGNAGLRFGGVHAVAPALVFEIVFSEVRPSRRHRIGATLVGARVSRWLRDAPPGAAQLAADLFTD